jgi:hypothetical protein
LELIDQQIGTFDFNFTLEDADFDRITEHVQKVIGPQTGAAPVDYDALTDRVQKAIRLEVTAEQIAELVEKVAAKVTPPVARIELVKPNGKVKKLDDVTHPAMADVLMLADARMNILLVGPAGSGKSHLAKQVAEALELDFAFISCSAGMSEGQLLGRLIPTGKNGSFEYVRSEFVRCYEEGGVFLLDEIDAADSNTMLIINAADLGKICCGAAGAGNCCCGGAGAGSSCCGAAGPGKICWGAAGAGKICCGGAAIGDWNCPAGPPFQKW